MAKSNPDIQAIGCWASYLGSCLELATSNPDIQAIIRLLAAGLGTYAWAPKLRLTTNNPAGSWQLGQVPRLRHPG